MGLAPALTRGTPIRLLCGSESYSCRALRGCVDRRPTAPARARARPGATYLTWMMDGFVLCFWVVSKRASLGFWTLRCARTRTLGGGVRVRGARLHLYPELYSVWASAVVFYSLVYRVLYTAVLWQLASLRRTV